MVFSVLFCTVLSCHLLYCAILHFIVLYSTLLSSSLLYSSLLFSTLLYSSHVYSSILLHSDTITTVGNHKSATDNFHIECINYSFLQLVKTFVNRVLGWPNQFVQHVLSEVTTPHCSYSCVRPRLLDFTLSLNYPILLRFCWLNRLISPIF